MVVLVRKELVVSGMSEAPEKPGEEEQVRKCAFVLKMKHRTCNLPARAGSLYCATHDPAATDRVPCPKDPSHSVRASQLERHLKRCKGKNIERVCSEPYYSAGVNLTPSQKKQKEEQAQEQDQEKEVKEKGLWKRPEVVEDVVAMLERLAEAPETKDFMAREPEARVLVFDRAEEVERGMFRSSSVSRKHGPQVSSIVENMRQAGFVGVSTDQAASTGFVEFGAGKAHLAKVVAAAVVLSMGKPLPSAAEPPPEKRPRTAPEAAAPEPPEEQKEEKEDEERVAFVLVDRAKFAASTEHSSWGRVLSSSVAFARVQIDISDLVLARVPALARCFAAGSRGRVVAFGKHLCGMGCDTALRCVVKAHEAAPDTQFGVAIAMCCLHRCTWDSFCNTGFLERHGISSDRFAALTGIAAWATSGAPAAAESEAPTEAAAAASSKARGYEERRRLGLMARRLITEGRLDFLRQNGFADACVVRFVDEATSPENWLLLAHTSNWSPCF